MESHRMENNNLLFMIINIYDFLYAKTPYQGWVYGEAREVPSEQNLRICPLSGSCKCLRLSFSLVPRSFTLLILVLACFVFCIHFFSSKKFYLMAITHFKI